MSQRVVVTRFELGRLIASTRGWDGLRMTRGRAAHASALFGVSQAEARRAFDAFIYCDEALRPGALIDILDGSTPMQGGA